MEDATKVLTRIRHINNRMDNEYPKFSELYELSDLMRTLDFLISRKHDMPEQWCEDK